MMGDMTDANPNNLPHDSIKESVRIALAEDVGSGDLTAGLVSADRQAEAMVISRQDAVVCGQAWFDEVFRQLDRSTVVEWRKDDGDAVAADEIVCEVHGSARAMLTGERTALNFLQLLSGTATITRSFVSAVAGTGATILDTRKTLPGLRLAQKYAVRCGGAENHRMGLYDAILIKENHIASAGSIEAAVAAASAHRDVLIEVEVETLEQVAEALTTNADRLLLDNFSLRQLSDAVKLRDQTAPDLTLEASGGISLASVRKIADTGVNFISVGGLTKDVEAADLSMQFKFVEESI
jgi:nicotinate-nucleotide pyrophosphorylase (carboxylating)